MEKDMGSKLLELRVDGGASRDNFLMQFQADIIESALLRPVIKETTALGAAYLAGLTTGFWKDQNEVRGKWQCDTKFKPGMDDARRNRLIAGWHKAVGRSVDWQPKDDSQT